MERPGEYLRRLENSGRLDRCMDDVVAVWLLLSGLTAIALVVFIFTLAIWKLVA